MMKSPPRRGLQLAKFIRESREMLSLTQEELARKLRISSPDIVSHWESGDYGISNARLETLAAMVNRERGRYKKAIAKPPVKVGSGAPKFDQLWSAVQRVDELKRRMSAS